MVESTYEQNDMDVFVFQVSRESGSLPLQCHSHGTFFSRCMICAANLRQRACFLLQPFHIAFPVDDLSAARDFYGRVLGCPEGRSSDEWIDFDLYGHQIVAHLKPCEKVAGAAHSNAVDGHAVPVPHFGVVLTKDDWQKLAQRMREAGVKFIIEPYTRFAGEIGEQSTMFFLDPAGNALEFKAFADLSQLFAK